MIIFQTERDIKYTKTNERYFNDARYMVTYNHDRKEWKYFICDNCDYRPLRNKAVIKAINERACISNE